MAKTLGECQTEAREFLGEELKHPRLGAVLGLSEEVGELVKEIMELEIYNTPRLPLSDEAKASLSDEIGDILFSLLEVCSAYEIELETAYEGKFAKIRDKRADWIARFGQQLQARRFQLDQ